VLGQAPGSSNTHNRCYFQTSIFRIQASLPKPCTSSYLQAFVSFSGTPFTVVCSSPHRVITTLDETIPTSQTSPRSIIPTAHDQCPANGPQQFLPSGESPLPGRAVIPCASFEVGGLTRGTVLWAPTPTKLRWLFDCPQQINRNPCRSLLGRW
jgi:hypothetical protein